MTVWFVLMQDVPLTVQYNYIGIRKRLRSISQKRRLHAHSFRVVVLQPFVSPAVGDIIALQVVRFFARGFCGCVESFEPTRRLRTPPSESWFAPCVNVVLFAGSRGAAPRRKRACSSAYRLSRTVRHRSYARASSAAGDRHRYCASLPLIRCAWPVNLSSA